MATRSPMPAVPAGSSVLPYAPMLRFIGVASALGAPVSRRGDDGPRDGASALAAGGIVAAARRNGIEAAWVGRLEVPAGPPGPALHALLDELAEEVAAGRQAGGIPVVLGGDHAVAAGTWRGIGRALGAPPGLIWIDAHLDAHTEATTATGNAHGMPLAALLGHGALAGIAGPRLDPARVVVIGARAFDPAERRLLDELGVTVHDIAAVRRQGFSALFAAAVRQVGAAGAWGISIDLDAFDPAVAPAVTTPVDGGLSAGEVAGTLRGLLLAGDCVALEIVEYCPARDPQGITARLALDLVDAATAPTASTLRAWEAAHGARNYAPLPVVLAEGRGCWLTDTEGRRYLDLMSAYSAVSLGHAHPRLTAALTAQAQRLAVTSRAFSNDRLPVFLRRLTRLTGYDRALPANTGLEAVETALKAARKWAYRIKGVPPERATIIACDGNFHGRSIAIVGLSSEPQYRDGFGPYPPGLVRVPYGDVSALEAAITPETAAFLVEPIQGEGGIIVPPPGYLAACARVCREQGVLLIADEVQTGLGRTGRLLACEHEGVRPDGVILGKALGGGLLPVSAFLADERIMQVFAPGDHGSTFGGNPLAAAVALEALDVLQDERLIERSAELGDWLLARLRALAAQVPAIRAVRGRGLFAGIELDPARADARAVAEALLARGVLTKDTHGTVLRFAPPLTITRDELDWGLDQIESVFHDLGGGLARAA